VMAIALSILAFCTTVLTLRTVFSHVDSEEALIARRLKTLSVLPGVDLRKVELSAPVWERLLAPPVRWFMEQVSKRTPRQILDETRTKLEAAGNPWNMKPATFVALKAMLSLVVPGCFMLMTAPFDPKKGVFLALCISFGGHAILEFAVGRKRTQRDRAIEKDLPDALDLLTISVEAGLGFDSALAKVAERMAGPVAKMFDHLLAEIRLGKPRREALRELGRRAGVRDLATVASAIVQADQLGINIGSVLRIQSELMRTKRRQKAEEKAMKAPIKMVLPLVVFIFPALFVVLLGPAVIQVISTLGGQ
jgi:tight adherence protein C